MLREAKASSSFSSPSFPPFFSSTLAVVMEELPRLAPPFFSSPFFLLFFFFYELPSAGRELRLVVEGCDLRLFSPLFFFFLSLF